MIQIEIHNGEMGIPSDRTDINIYVTSDIHNDAVGFKRLLRNIEFTDDDILIIAGDIFDRGEEPVELYFEILKHPNILVIQGNHDVWVRREILDKYTNGDVGPYISYNTVEIMEQRLTQVDLLNLAEWIHSNPFYIKLNLNGVKYQIAHAQTFPTPENIFDNRKIYMGDAHYDAFIEGKELPKDFISVVGHTPTHNHKILISKSGKLIRTDCGNGYQYYGENSTLGAIRLNDLQIFYARNN